jgi:hypothetical protein
MIQIGRFLIVTAILTFTVGFSTYAAETNDVVSQIDHWVSLGEKADNSLIGSIADGIKKNPSEALNSLLPKLQDKNLTEKQVAVYIWALGLTKDEGAVNTIMEVYQKRKVDLVRANCIRALATIGGKQAGDFLMSTLDATSNMEKRADILDLLGQMQYEAALPKTEEILRLDIKEYYWQSIFLFGKMGDQAVPFLLKKIKDKDRNIRANAINVLGQWLISPEAAKPLQKQFWMEKDIELRNMILSSLERTITDLSQMKTVFEQVVAKEKNKELVKFARETLDNIDKIKAEVMAFAKKKQVSAVSFKREYVQLFDSAGKKGSYEVLGASSTLQDESQLKALRERILQRNSDEAFYDYQKVNDIIMRNRMMKAIH